MTFFSIVIVSILGAVAYGVIHDQFTARLSLEYFTVGHPRLFDHDNPTIHAAAWGVIATWWVGLYLGLLLATAARVGTFPKLRLRQVAPIILGVMIACAVSALVVGVVTSNLVDSDALHLPARWQRRVSPEQHRGFLIASYVHLTSYIAGGTSGLIAAALLLWKRIRLRSNDSSQPFSA